MSEAQAGKQAGAKAEAVRTLGREALVGKRVRVTYKAVLRGPDGEVKEVREGERIEEVEQA